MLRRLPLLLVGVLAGSMIVSCTVGPDYQRPAIDTPAAYVYEPTAVADTANTRWWQSFGDPVLDALIVEALANNKNVLIAAANVEQAAGAFVTTRSPLFPQFGYGAEGSRERFSKDTANPIGQGVKNPQTNYQAGGTASWEIDLWGRIRRQTESAQANLLATEEARRGVLLTLVSTVATGYVQLRALDEQLVIAERTLVTYVASLQLFESQFKYGVVSEMTVAQARTQYETAMAQIPQIQQQIVETENALSVLLGRNPGPIPRGRKLDDIQLPVIPAGLPSDLLVRRPDLAQAEQNLIAANAQIGAAQALYFPTISLTGFLGGASDSLSNLFDGPARQWNYAGTVTGPIFSGGGIMGQVAQAKAAQKAALSAYEGAIQAAFADVENALSARQKLGDQLAAEQRLVQALRDYARLAHLQYDGGYTSYLTVLIAEQQLFPAELNYTATRAAVFNSVTNIYKATGGGWIEEADAQAPQPQSGGPLFPAVGLP
jgi:multidrug efflux system outer membrane protein